MFSRMMMTMVVVMMLLLQHCRHDWVSHRTNQKFKTFNNHIHTLYDRRKNTNSSLTRHTFIICIKKLSSKQPTSYAKDKSKNTDLNIAKVSAETNLFRKNNIEKCSPRRRVYVFIYSKFALFVPNILRICLLKFGIGKSLYSNYLDLNVLSKQNGQMYIQTDYNSQICNYTG